ncbi:MAG: NTP transferase domain-containing protein [Proteobacteria bacterium]|nr:NTP transferase domain-containing protein [Pseudomonadota bacterium]
MAAPLYGLVLAGGRSSRMRSDKAALTYQGEAQLERAVRLLGGLLPRVFVSVRADQAEEPLRARFERIVDRHEDLGPIAGVLAAQAAHPAAAWLVLACDLPLLDSATLDTLLREREPGRLATAYRSSHDGLPEPLCAIYEPASAAALRAHVAAGKRCPRKFLASADAKLIEEPNPRALDNINTPEEYARAMTTLTRPATRVSVQYYALLREQAGRREETLVTDAGTAQELYAQLAQRYPFTLPAQMLRVAVNAEFVEWDRVLKDGDAVVFIPPVAGG